MADGFRPATDERYLKSPAEMHRRFERYPGAIRNALALAEEPHLRLEVGSTPPSRLSDAGTFSFRDGVSPFISLGKGPATIYPGNGEGLVDPMARTRLEHELDIIDRLGFAGYFLVVWDIVTFARSQDIYCQIRGSGADSAVCRCLGLTRVDPIRLGLPFERFPLRGTRSSARHRSWISKPTVAKR